MRATFLSVTLVVFTLFSACNGKTKKDNPQKKLTTSSPEASSPQAPSIPIHEAAFNGNVSIVKNHLAANTNADSVNQDGQTPIMLAAFNGHTEVVKLLAENGASLTKSDQKGLTPLHFAASGPFPETVQYLLENGASINATDSIENFTPLMYAASEGNMEVVRILLKYGADPYLKDIDGDNAANFAIQNNHPEIGKLLKNLPK
ncbi:ankyrin repeat domain-containing protein [Thermophagus sp. OGC60D27]|uniref:ankyrin repeat domain-containing protein n=1 Tax=Thermophagus sp. OGC60D27 TaxID=3458415 RepID=UPI0040381785